MTHRRTARPPAPCGTIYAYKRHRRRGEVACDLCKAAWAAYNREQYARRTEEARTDGA